MQAPPPENSHRVPTSRLTSASRAATVVLILVAVGWTVARVLGLAASPSGFSLDESLAGLHARCLAETGHSADGEPWPTFAKGLGGGLYTPLYLYALVGWTKVFGTSIAAVRSLGATFSILATIALTLLGGRLFGRRGALLVGAAAALSPWSFELSRLGADAPIVAPLISWGCYCFLRSPRPVWAAAGGALMAAAAYSYPPVRLTAPLLVLMLVLAERRRMTWPRAAAFMGTAAALTVPLAIKIADGSLMGRSNALSILNIDYIRDHRGPLPVPVFVVKQLLENLMLHLQPSYLFFTGDPNVRHSTQAIGMLGYLDTFAVALTAGVLLVTAIRVIRADAPVLVSCPPQARAGAWAIVAAGFATLPAALCWEGLPHAYRSIAAYPAVAVFTGACLLAAWDRFRPLPIVLAGLAVLQTLIFFPDYFGDYRRRAHRWFNGSLRDAAEKHDRAEFDRIVRDDDYPPLGFRYYLAQEFGFDCEGSRVEAERIRKR